jgi:hypothetical protein
LSVFSRAFHTHGFIGSEQGDAILRASCGLTALTSRVRSW